MGRWQPDAAERLAGAAVELFGSRGYDRTTVAEIAQRAGLTERTFFRHFADKREVLFGGSASLQEAMLGALQSTPASAAPMDGIAAALLAAAELFRDRRDHARRRQALVVATAELRERELSKMAALAAALAETLRARGVPEPTASLAAETGIAIFKVAFERWVDGDQDLGSYVQESLDQLATATDRTSRP